MNTHNITIYLLVGFFAQLVDGALGMAYGVTSSTFLTASGVPIKVASASVHTAEVFTTLVSGFSHWKAKNIDWLVFAKLVIPGVLGGAVGAYLLAGVQGEIIAPFSAVYLLLMGIFVIIRALFNKKNAKGITGKGILFVGLVGGFFDAVGGGGWGPIVTSTMVASGHPPRYTIGSVNTAEFFVTIVQTLTFALFLGVGQYITVIVGLAIGGVIAAPIAAFLCKRLPEKWLMLSVGVLIVLLNIKKLYDLIA